MAMGTERSKALHNFTLPCELRWGNQRFLRCMKVNSDGQISPLRRFTAANKSFSSDRHHHHNNSTQQPRTISRDRERGRERDSFSEFMHSASDGGQIFTDDGDDGGIAAVREKLMIDLQTAAVKMKDVIFKDGFVERDVSGSSPSLQPPAPPAAAAVEGEIHRPWDLRTRRAACKTTPVSTFISSINGGAAVAGGDKDITGVNGSPVGAGLAAAVDRSSRLRGGGDAVAANGEKRDRPKFAVALSKKDIEEDFLAMVGRRPARRPKKRAKIIQRQLDTLFPGLWLTEVTPDMYKVSEAATQGR